MTQRTAAAQRTKYVPDETDLPTQWYNIQADLKTLLPPVLHPGTGQPIGPQDLAPLFPMALIAQEVSQERWIDIPEDVRDVLRLWRPSPLYRARRLERALDTPACIYYKYEGVRRPSGATSPTHPWPRRITTSWKVWPGLPLRLAPRWGLALAMACSFFGLECKVYMVKISYNQKPYCR